MFVKYRVIRYPLDTFVHSYHVQRKLLWLSWKTIDIFRTKEEAISFAEYKNGNMEIVHEC